MRSGQEVRLNIEFAYDSLAIKAIAKVAYVGKEDNQYRIGLEFIDITPENAKVIESILDRYQFRNVMDVSDLKS